MAYHGHPRATGDIDILVENSTENAQRLIAVLDRFGFGTLGPTAADFLTPETIVQLGYPPNRIDLITSLTGVEFAAAWESRIRDRMGDVAFNVIDRTNLLLNKAAGRPKDLADLEALS